MKRHRLTIRTTSVVEIDAPDADAAVMRYESGYKSNLTAPPAVVILNVEEVQ